MTKSKTKNKGENEMLYRACGQEIKKVRMALMLQQDEFGEKIDAKIPSISNWENGRHKPRLPYLKRIKKLADENKIKFNFELFIK